MSDHLPDHLLKRHFEKSTYGDFELPEAIRPGPRLDVIPTEGYRKEFFYDGNHKIPVTHIALSKDRILAVFLDLIDICGPECEVVLETSKTEDNHRKSYHFDHIDTTVFKSLLCEYEEYLLSDGTTGVCVLNPHIPFEAQFDEHKLLIVFGQDSLGHLQVLSDHGVRYEPNLKLITDAEHIHSSSDQLQETFKEFRARIGYDEYQSEYQSSY
jgi:hypothetical protein